MKEIELKAHVDDKEKTAELIGTFAQFKGSVTRNDTYWKKDGIEIRIRKELAAPCPAQKKLGTADGPAAPAATTKSATTLVTYKRKQTRTAPSGTVMEVNDEKECTVSSAEPLEAFLQDAGFSVSLKKHKEVISWTQSSGATLELCTVPPLGHFLEIEILSAADDEVTVKKSRETLEALLKKSGITKDKLEGRYYSELLREYNATL